MKTFHLIGIIKNTIAEGESQGHGFSMIAPTAPRPPSRPSGGIAGPLASSPPSVARSTPPPTGGATFGGGTAGSGAPLGTTFNNVVRQGVGTVQKALGQEPTQGLGSQKTNMSHLRQPAPESQKTAPINRAVSKMGSSENAGSYTGSQGQPIRSGGIGPNQGRQSFKTQGTINTTDNLPRTGGGISGDQNRSSMSKLRSQERNYRGPLATTDSSSTPTLISKANASTDGKSMNPSGPPGTRHQQTSSPTRPSGPPGSRHASPSVSNQAQQAQKARQQQQQTTARRPPRPMKMARTRPANPSGRWGFGAGSGRQDAGSITNRALGAVNEHINLIETIKKLAKRKNCECDTAEGEGPKGTPDGFKLNPPINSLFQNR